MKKKDFSVLTYGIDYSYGTGKICRKPKNFMDVSFSHRIDETILAKFEKVAEVLPGAKHEILEAAIRAFTVLPEGVQFKLLSGNDENRQIVLDMLAALAIPLKEEQGVRPAKRAKSG